MQRHILTGQPGAGKTAILRGLEAAGHFVVEEAATDVIALEQARGNISPHENADFIEAIVTRQIARQRLADRSGARVVFFDRSPICAFALSAFLGLPVPGLLAAELERIAVENTFARRVLFIQPLGFITRTEARRIDYADALRFGRLHEETYRALGYECLMIAPAPLDQRIAAVERAVEDRP